MMNPKARGWITALAMLASVFLAGLLAGAAVVELGGSPRDGPSWREVRDRDGRGSRDGRGGPGPGRREMVPLLPESVMEELALSDAQRVALQEILERRGAEAREILESMGPRLRAQVDSGRAEIRALLDPEQREIFDRLQEMRGRRSRGGAGPSLPPGRP